MSATSVCLGELMCASKSTIDPRRTPEQLYDLISIPAHDAGVPEVVTGAEVGSSKQVLQPGDVLLSKIVPHIRRAGVVRRLSERPIIGSSEWIVFRSQRFIPEYLRHVLIGDDFHALFIRTVAGVGGSLLRARPSQVAEIEIPLPPIEEQRRIASILDAADALRSKRRQALEKLDTLTQSIFIDMFGSNHHTVTLSDLLAEAHLFTDGDWVESKDQDPDGTVRLTQLADVGVGVWVDKSRRYMTPERADFLKCTFLQPGDVLVARMPDPIGRACLFPGDPMRAVTAVDVCIIRPDARTLNARWLVEALNLASTLRQVNAFAVGATRQRVSRSNLGKVTLPRVGFDRQELFAQRALTVDGVRAQAAAALAEAGHLFASLQHRAFRGEL